MPLYTSKTSLKKYLIKSQLLSSALLLSFFVICLSLLSVHIFKKYSENNLKLLSTSLSSQLEAAVVFDDQQSIHEILTKFMNEYPIDHITIIDTQGFILASVHNRDHQQFHSSFLNDLQHWIIANEAGFSIISHNQQPLAKLEVYNSVDPLLTFLQLLLWAFLGTILLSIALIRFSTRSMYRQITTSLDLLTQTTERLTEHRDFNHRVPLGDIYEFNKISISFNALLTEMQTWHINLKKENSHLEHQALHDNLTQLPNRAYFHQYLDELFKQEFTHRNFALFYIDNNHFKMINDHYGHPVGDAVLCEMTIRLKKALRSDDFIARIGGDEFAVLLPNLSNPSHASVVAKNLLAVCDQPLILENLSPIYFSISIGIALSQHANTSDDLIHQADQAMYAAKLNQWLKFSFYQQPSETHPSN